MTSPLDSTHLTNSPRSQRESTWVSHVLQLNSTKVKKWWKKSFWKNFLTFTTRFFMTSANICCSCQSITNLRIDHILSSLFWRELLTPPPWEDPGFLETQQVQWYRHICFPLFFHGMMMMPGGYTATLNIVHSEGPPSNVDDEDTSPALEEPPDWRGRPGSEKDPYRHIRHSSR